MEDTQSIDLYFARDERAIRETDAKYGRFCLTVASNILTLPSDAEGCVSDTYLHAWNAMPPQRPDRLSAFLGRIARNLALNRWETYAAEKRGAGQTALALDELGPRQACVCRELTKVHEEFILFRLEDPASHPDALLGELTVLVGPPEGAVRSSEAEVREALEAEAMAGGKPKAMARRAAERVAGWSAKEIYALLQTPRGD